MITGHYDKHGMPRLRATVSNQNQSAKAKLEFLISTGASNTLIPRRIAAALGWQRPETPLQNLQFRGIPVPCHRQWMTLAMAHDDRVVTEHLINAGIPETTNRPDDIPPVLGRDFLNRTQTLLSAREGRAEIHLHTNQDRRD